jgi:hypothetical protein
MWQPSLFSATTAQHKLEVPFSNFQLKAIHIYNNIIIGSGPADKTKQKPKSRFAEKNGQEQYTIYLVGVLTSPRVLCGMARPVKATSLPPKEVIQLPDNASHLTGFRSRPLVKLVLF